MSFEAGLAPAPAWIATLVAEADAAEARGNDPLAIAILRRAASESRTPAILRRLGLALLRAGRMPEAAEALRRGLLAAPEDPEIRYGLGVAMTALGRLREGAALAEARFELPRLEARKPHGLPFAEWRGEPAAGKRLVVFPELGLADQILAARYVPTLQAAGAEVVLVCPPELERLYADSFAGVTVIPAMGAPEFGDPDGWTTIGALPGWLAGTGTPPPPPYLRAAAGSRRRAGLTIAFASDGLPQAEAQRLREGLPGQVTEVPAQDLAAAAVVMADADLVVCVDGVAAQLASGLGRPTFVLVPARDPHWSFGIGPQSAAWHPTARIFRAEPRGAWDAAVERLLLAAEAWPG